MRSLLAVALSLALAVGVSSAAPTAGEGSSARHGPALVLRGGVRGLYPGARLSLRVRIRNGRPFAVRVLAIRTRVVGGGRRGCARRYVAVSRLRARLRVPPRRARTALLRVTMRRSAPDACKGAVFRLAFSARGRRA